MKTTLNKIRQHSPCTDGWTKLLKNLGKTQADDEPLAITTILDSNGLEDALWCLRAVDGYQREMRLYAVDCARSVQHLMKDPRSITALDTAECHANGLATDAELSAAASAAASAAWSAAAAAAAARSAARSAAESAAWLAAGAAAAWSAESAAESAASAAWLAAASAAARAAAAAAAGAAAWLAAQEVQADLLRIVCAEIEQREGTE